MEMIKHNFNFILSLHYHLSHSIYSLKTKVIFIEDWKDATKLLLLQIAGE